MKPFVYYSPTKIVYDEKCVINKKEHFKPLGNKALILTGANSYSLNHALVDVENALDDIGIEHVHVKGATFNTPHSVISDWVSTGISEKVDFVIGIGGGSALDLAKVVSLLINNPDLSVKDLIESEEELLGIPLATVATTIGHGANVSKYAMMCSEDSSKRIILNQSNPPIVTFLDANYPAKLDLLSLSMGASSIVPNLFASYLSFNWNTPTRMLIEENFFTFGKCIEHYGKEEYPIEYVQGLLFASTMSGVAVSQVSPSLVHYMSLPLCTSKNISYSHATMILSVAILRYSGESMDILNLLNSMWMRGYDDYQASIDATAKKIPASDEEIEEFADEVMINCQNLNFINFVTREHIVSLYRNSLN